MDLQDLDSLTVEYMGMERCDPENLDFQNYTTPVDVMNSEEIPMIGIPLEP